jgi:alpha-tubulin suppressor-like RCC1 family protein
VFASGCPPPLCNHLGVQMVKPLSDVSVTAVACGQDCCFCVTRFGELYSWGGNSLGQLAQGHSEPWVAAPTLCPPVPNRHVTQVAPRHPLCCGVRCAEDEESQYSISFTRAPSILLGWRKGVE